MIFKELGKIFEKDLQRCHSLTFPNQATIYCPGNQSFMNPKMIMTPDRTQNKTKD